MALAEKLAEIRPKVDSLDAETRAKLDRDMAIKFDEHFAFQECQARNHAMGRLSTEDAQLIYVALGEVGSASNGGWAPRTDTATKVLVTLAIGELLTR
jgi:hypothetical protein